jgi:hypothetical protein
MRVPAILRQVLKTCRQEVHAKRFAAMLAVIGGIVGGRKLSLTAIGRALGGRTYPKHSIKRVDRLLSNEHMDAERQMYFRDMAALLIGPCPRPVVLLDWTKMTDNFHALVAAVPIGGRALTIYEEVHPERKLGSPRVQKEFLRRLRQVLPVNCRPIIVTDAGFQGPFFSQVQRLGWDFVGRLRGFAKMISEAGGEWKTVADLQATAGRGPRDMGAFRLYKRSKSVGARLVLAGKRRRHRKHPWTGRWSAQGGTSLSTISGAKEPWLLATSIPSDSAERIIGIYATRMQIEETFRDAKNHRFGWCLRHVRGYRAVRLTLLLLFAVLAILAVTLLGLAASAAGRQRRYQANTARTKVLSFFVLGAAIVQRRDYAGLADVVRHGRTHCHDALAALCPT